MDLILLGAPGAGKGTQGALLAERRGVPKIATGEILREAVRADSELGRKARGYMDAGELVPDEVILGLVRDALSTSGSAGGAIFDGFPRTIAQAESLDRILAELHRRIDAVVVIEVPEETIVERMSGRRTDPQTGEVYHVRHNPAPPEIADRLIQRDDDRESTVRRRLAVYRENTAPLIEYYRRSAAPIHTVNGARSIDVVQADVLARVTL
jgi:adenylate kinase